MVVFICFEPQLVFPIGWSLYLFQKRTCENKWQVFTGQMLFLLPNQQSQSTERNSWTSFCYGKKCCLLGFQQVLQSSEKCWFFIRAFEWEPCIYSLKGCSCYSHYVAGIVQLLEPVKEMLHTELTRKLTSTDAVLKDSIAKLVRSKVTDQLHCKHFVDFLHDCEIVVRFHVCEKCTT